MHIFVGLGNPGQHYSEHRHNVGYMAVDEIVRRHSFAAGRKRFQGISHDGAIAGEKVMVLKPATFMNESGRSVGEAMRYFKLTPTDITVFHDELDLVAGKIRIKLGGGVAGHNGLKSLRQHIGADFRRVRIGISHPGHRARVHKHVLGDFAKSDRPWVEDLCIAMAEAAEFLVRGDAAGFSTKVSLIVQPEKPAKAKTSANRASEAKSSEQE